MSNETSIVNEAPSQGRVNARSRRGSKIAPDQVHEFLKQVVGEDFHAKRVLSLADGVIGVLHAATLGVHAIGRGLAAARNLEPKHAIKQVDRLLSNAGLKLSVLIAAWIRFVVGARKEIVVALDWTEFDKDDHSVIALYLVTNHGRATPLVWNCAKKSEIKNLRSVYEFEAIETLHNALPEDGVVITLLADRGFGDVKLYDYLNDLGWGYVIRFREGIYVKHRGGEKKRASEWLAANGRARKLTDALVTNAEYPVESVVVVRAPKMKETWCLASNLRESAANVVALYARRFTIEETFRDTKDIHFGMGLSATHIKSPERRERLLLLSALAHALLTLLGEAGEKAGLDQKLKANTVKKRTLSLYRQGSYWYSAIPAMDDVRLRLLMRHFEAVLHEHRAFSDIFGTI